MGIPIGKLQLYTAAAGVPPQGLLPMYLDAGTNNETYLGDPLYVGLRQCRPSTDQLYTFVDEFVEAVQEVFPNCCIHFEDWTGVDAIALLARYRNKVCCYNDAIQGTAGVTLAWLINALKITGGQLKGQRILCGQDRIRQACLHRGATSRLYCFFRHVLPHASAGMCAAHETADTFSARG